MKSGGVMIHLKKIVLVGLLLLWAGGTLNGFAQTFPLQYAGELNVCGKVSADMKEGKSLESALVNLFLSYSDQPVQIYGSIQRSIVFTAIHSCHYDGADVIRAALRIDMFVPLLVLSMSEAGVNPQTLHDVLQQAGLNRSAIDNAFEIAGVGQPPSPGYALALPPPFEISGGGGVSGSVGGGGGLGQASPFIP
jgi:hypothetical protein